jgi:hypothetical protein
LRGCFAQIAYTLKVVSNPLALFTSPIHEVPDGNELLTLALSELEEMNTPPPQITVSAGHDAIPRVCVPVAAPRAPVLTTVYRFGIVEMDSGRANDGGSFPAPQEAGRPSCGDFVSCRTAGRPGCGVFASAIPLPATTHIAKQMTAIFDANFIESPSDTARLS